MKRHYAYLPITAAVLALTACSLQDAPADDEVEQNAEAPLTLLTHPTIYDALGGDTMIEEFEEETGLTVDVTTADIGPHLDRLMTDYQAGTGTYDVVALQNTDYMPRVTEGLLPLDDLISEVPDDWAWEDFVESLRNFAAVDGVQYGVPVRIGTQMLYYRTDLLEEAGIEPPETFDEYADAARELDSDDVHGAVQRGIPRELVDDWLGFHFSAGGQIVDEANTCTLDSEAGVAATELMADLMSEGVLPADMFAWGRDDYISAMQRGHAAMGVYFSPYWGFLVNPDDSEVAEDIGFALSPTAGDAAPGTSRVLTWNLSVTNASQNQAGAWQLIQYATNPDNSLRSAIEFANGPVRTSVYLDEEYQEEYPVAEAWLESAEVAQADPPMDELPAIYDIIATHVTSAIDGSVPVPDALENACGQIDQLIA